MSHLIANSSASVEVMPTAWCKVFSMRFKYEWIYTIDIAMLFLILTSETTIIELKLDEALRTMSSSLQKWAVLLSLSL